MSADDPADAAVWEDWSRSMIPPPVTAVEGVEHGEPYVPLVLAEPDRVEAYDGRHVRNLTAAQARELAAALTARADVIDPPADEPGEPAPEGHPHRDTIATMREVTAWMPRTSLRAKLRQCANRLQVAECAATTPPTRAETRTAILQDWHDLTDPDAGRPSPGTLADLAADHVRAAVAQYAGHAVTVTRCAAALFAHEFDDPAIEWADGNAARLTEMARQARRGGHVDMDGDRLADLLDALRAADVYGPGAGR